MMNERVNPLVSNDHRNRYLNVSSMDNYNHGQMPTNQARQRDISKGGLTGAGHSNGGRNTKGYKLNSWGEEQFMSTFTKTFSQERPSHSYQWQHNRHPEGVNNSTLSKRKPSQGIQWAGAYHEGRVDFRRKKDSLHEHINLFHAAHNV